MLVTSPAKINLFLHVGGRRRDGYHYVDSLFCLLDFGDELHVHSAETFRFTCSHELGIPAEDNLVVKAARAFTQLYDKQKGSTLPSVHIHLEKRIPHGAGLGGGSSNAAATIYALAREAGVRPDLPEHLELAAKLGSDVPLFLAPTAMSVMTGRGELLARSLPPIAGLPVVLVQPPHTHNSTAAVYRAFDAATSLGCAFDFALAPLIDTLLQQASVKHIAAKLSNNLDTAAGEVCSATAQTLALLRSDKRVLGAVTAGSGSACFALCATNTDAQTLACQWQRRGFWAQACNTAACGITACDDAGKTLN